MGAEASRKRALRYTAQAAHDPGWRQGEAGPAAEEQQTMTTTTRPTVTTDLLGFPTPPSAAR